MCRGLVVSSGNTQVGTGALARPSRAQLGRQASAPPQAGLFAFCTPVRNALGHYLALTFARRDPTGPPDTGRRRTEAAPASPRDTRQPPQNPRKVRPSDGAETLPVRGWMARAACANAASPLCHGQRNIDSKRGRRCFRIAYRLTVVMVNNVLDIGPAIKHNFRVNHWNTDRRNVRGES